MSIQYIHYVRVMVHGFLNDCPVRSGEKWFLPDVYRFCSKIPSWSSWIWSYHVGTTGADDPAMASQRFRRGLLPQTREALSVLRSWIFLRALPNRGPIFTHNLAISWYGSCLCSYVVSLKFFFVHYSLLYFIFAITLAERKKKLLNKCSGPRGLHSVPNLIIQKHTKNIVFSRTWQNGAPIW